MTSGRKHSKLIKGIASAIVIALLGFLCLSGCSPVTRHKTLSFFFDGVPDPNRLPTGNESAAELRAEVSGGVASFHEPYQKMKCYSCHVPSRQRTAQETDNLLVKTTEEGLCQTCHKTIPDDVPYIHAPALINACLECHHHHKAPYRKLLLKGGDNLCYRCHEKSDLSAGEHHAKPLAADHGHDTTCVTCHNPHHGRSRYFLRSKEKFLEQKETEVRQKSSKEQGVTTFKSNE